LHEGRSTHEDVKPDWNDATIVTAAAISGGGSPVMIVFDNGMAVQKAEPTPERPTADACKGWFVAGRCLSSHESSHFAARGAVPWRCHAREFWRRVVDLKEYLS
jgi:hypothetical protein